MAYCFASVCLGQDALPKIIIVPSVQTVQPVQGPPTIAQYKIVFAGLEEITKNVFDENSWKKVAFRHRVTKKVVKWSDFTDFEKKLYCLTMSEQVEARLVYIQKAWTWELNKFKNPAHVLTLKAVTATGDNRPALKKDIEEYLAKILVLRKSLAKEVESVTIDTFDKYADKIPKAERDSWLKKLQAKHDEEKLIDRKPVVAPPVPAPVPGKEDAKVPSDG
jgi:hypothetical protein